MITLALSIGLLSAPPACPPDWEPDMLPARLTWSASEAVRGHYRDGELEAEDFSAAMRATFRWDQGRDPKWQDFDWLFGLTKEPEPDCLNVVGVIRDLSDLGDVVATFQNGGVAVSRQFAMVREDGVWKIDDIAMEPEGWMLSEYLAVDPAVRRHEAPGEDQTRGAWGLGLGDGIREMLTNLYATADEGGAPPRRYLSSDLQRLFADDAIREWNRVDFDWLHGGQEAADVSKFSVVVLNTTGPLSDRPASASALVRFDNAGEAVSRRFHLVDDDGYWVVGDVCLWPEAQGLRGLLEARPDPGC